MTTFRNTPASSNRQVNVDALLRDVAFVLRMTRKVKSEMLCEPANSTSADNEQFTCPEPGVCAV
jgi:hypothetical protein